MEDRIGAVTELSFALHATQTMHQTGREILAMCEKIWGSKNAAAMFQKLAGENNAEAVKFILERPWQAAPLHSDNWALRTASKVIRSMGGYDRLPDLAKDLHGRQIDKIPDLQQVIRKLTGDIEVFKSAMKADHVQQRIGQDDKSSYLILQSRLAGEVNNAWHQMVKLHPYRSDWDVPENPTPAVIKETIDRLKQDRAKRGQYNKQELDRLVTELPKQDATIVPAGRYRKIIHSAGIRGFSDVVDRIQKWAKDGKVGTKCDKRPPEDTRTKHHRRTNPSATPPHPIHTGPEQGR
ncbi:MAG: hypothetical protein EYC62_03805 [Alphaproteobacteria bacterium]|nr:MAG: hypothetical protein EYC62_03805 [Alphaproteobacteria bacterium]